MPPTLTVDFEFITHFRACSGTTLTIISVTSGMCLQATKKSSESQRASYHRHLAYLSHVILCGATRFALTDYLGCVQNIQSLVRFQFSQVF